MNALVSAPKSRSLLGGWAPGAAPSFGAGADAQTVDARIKSMQKLMSSGVANLASVKELPIPSSSSLPEKIRYKVASFKRLTATIAMHLDPVWRQTLLSTLDRLLDSDDWDEEFVLPSEQSFSTFLRMVIYLHPTKRPGLGLSANGHFLAAWTRGEDRIVIESLANDEVRWVLSRTVQGERESAAGKILLHRVPDVIAPYDPSPLFEDGDKVLA
jgi:hypothetical protein